MNNNKLIVIIVIKIITKLLSLRRIITIAAR